MSVDAVLMRTFSMAMPKKIKKIGILLGIILAVVLFSRFSLLLFVLPKLYATRLVECPPKNLLPTLEEDFVIKFPDGISETRTAKSIAVEGDHNYIVKFVASPNDVDKFFKSFPDESYTTYPLSQNIKTVFIKPDYSLHFIPRWFTRPIKEGTVSWCTLGNRDTKIYIDTADKEKHIVYIYGYYPKNDKE
ncbi:MAG: hypothetical protein ACYS32_00070 [Planctomycetota bacterium]|jgi:hypothetical protein